MREVRERSPNGMQSSNNAEIPDVFAPQGRGGNPEIPKIWLGRNRKGPNERAEDKLSTVGRRTGSEARNSGRAGEHKRSPTVIKLNPVEPDGARGKNQH